MRLRSLHLTYLCVNIQSFVSHHYDFLFRGRKQSRTFSKLPCFRVGGEERPEIKNKERDFCSLHGSLAVISYKSSPFLIKGRLDSLKLDLCHDNSPHTSPYHPYQQLIHNLFVVV